MWSDGETTPLILFPHPFTSRNGLPVSEISSLDERKYVRLVE